MRVVVTLLGLFVARSTCTPSTRHSSNSSLEWHQGTASTLPLLNAETRSSPCAGNTADNRRQWCEYDIHTDYTSTTPDTGAVREFWFELAQADLAPDGRTRWTLAINGSIPGPTIVVDWGDTVILHLRNSLPSSVSNATSMHFHGLRQLNTNPMDGVVSITQCPIAPGQMMTYRWRATQYGTTWYHSHIGLQTWEGVFGGIIINGPASTNYDEDKGVILLNDWDARTVDELWDIAQRTGPPTLDNALINGTNIFGDDGPGRRFQMSFAPGRSYRLRLGNAACDTHFKFSIDHHALTVIAADLVPIEPYITNVLDIAIGQRYDVIVHADHASLASAFWLRATPQLSCSKNLNADNIRGIVRYDTTHSLPNSTAHASTDSCTDEDPAHLIPVISHPLDLTGDNDPFYNETLPATLTPTTHSIYRWQLHGTSLQLNWTQPTLRQLHNPHTQFHTTAGLLSVPRADTWVLIIIETSVPIPHPVHLHGHDFLLVAQGAGPYAPSPGQGPLHHAAGALPKRDTALLPASGHLVLAFRTDNPGAWLLHCHVGWHLEQGFAVQVVEREDEIRDFFSGRWAREGALLEQNCVDWEVSGMRQGWDNGSGV
ncbi:uncharacterized protein N7482_009565 [Penicillium canariense]|uniref:Laccase n=1 Tax=Penicillium canariense TaxID=189055 RepID=A0A9W9HQE7_9EURO|nr:uncharacterized protein N7482_009565 [Penicillium canariense]KAJ5153087.1 hypothetical protein N7482_009565 [Penicillium canariense]